MNVIGIVCEYNPLHNGHLRQICAVRNHYGEDCVIVCAMSGNYVQRGAPAIFDKSIRAKAAILAGCDLVLELPVTTALSSAEGFARGGVEILARCCDTISFGTESMDVHSLFSTAKALLSDEFSAYLRDELSSGCSFPSARQAALRKMSLNVDLSGPNDILGVEYCKAIMENGLDMQVFPVFRNGSYHSQELEEAAPSATAVRREILSGGEWKYAIPENLYPLFEHASVHTL